MITNVVLIALNVATLLVSLLTGEYEVAKLLHPEALWVATPVAITLPLIIAAGVVAIVNLAVLVFVMLRRLHHHRRWLWWTTTAGIAFVVILGIIYGANFIEILWPNLTG